MRWNCNWCKLKQAETCLYYDQVARLHLNCAIKSFQELHDHTIYEDVSKSFRTESIKKYTLTTTNTRSEATQRVMAAKLTKLTHKISMQLHLVSESCNTGSSRSRWPVRKLLDTPAYVDERWHLTSEFSLYNLGTLMTNFYVRKIFR
jgi:hypothetical protein